MSLSNILDRLTSLFFLGLNKIEMNVDLEPFITFIQENILVIFIISVGIFLIIKIDFIVTLFIKIKSLFFKNNDDEINIEIPFHGHHKNAGEIIDVEYKVLDENNNKGWGKNNK